MLPWLHYIIYIGIIVIFINNWKKGARNHLITPPPPLDKMAAITQTIFADAFLLMKILYFDIKILLKFVAMGLNHYVLALL